MTNKLLIFPFIILASLSGCKKELPNEADSKAPSVSIVSPVNGSGMNADTTCTIVAEANDENGVASVEFLVDGDKVGVSTEAPYRMQLSMTGKTGNHSITANAYDKAGNVGKSPVVAIVVNDPSNGAPGDSVPGYSLSIEGPIPANGASNISYTYDFYWHCKKPDSVTVVYDLFIDTLATPIRQVGSGILWPGSLGVALRPATTYYWKIIATDSHGGKTSGPVWSFSTLPVFLPKAVSVASMTDNSVTFTWLGASVTNYEYVIEQSDDAGTYRPIKTAGPGLTGTVCPGSFVVGKTYNFRIKTVMDSKSSEYVYLQYLYEQPRTFDYPLAIGTAWEFGRTYVINSYIANSPYGTFTTTHGTQVWTVASNVKTSDTSWYATILRNSVDTTTVISIVYNPATDTGGFGPGKRSESQSITTKTDTVSIITYPDQYVASVPGFAAWVTTIPRTLLTSQDTVRVGPPVGQGWTTPHTLSVNNVGLVYLETSIPFSRTFYSKDEYTLRQFKRQ